RAAGLGAVRRCISDWLRSRGADGFCARRSPRRRHYGPHRRSLLPLAPRAEDYMMVRWTAARRGALGLAALIIAAAASPVRAQTPQRIVSIIPAVTEMLF